jgi:putative addiction module component (TIGR02574 family)
MTAEVSELLKKALALPPEARAELADSLLESLDAEPADEGVEAAWSVEIQRRIEEIDSGKVKMIPYTKKCAVAWRPAWPMPRSKPYRLHPQAWLELEAADDWYRERSAFLDGQRLSENPNSEQYSKRFSVPILR